RQPKRAALRPAAIRAANRTGSLPGPRTPMILGEPTLTTRSLMSDVRTLSIAFALLPALAACADQSPEPSLGDPDAAPVTTIRADGPGEWRSPPHLVEELRIGRLEGNDDYIFGSISYLAVGADGTIYVADGIGPRLRMYD